MKRCFRAGAVTGDDRIIALSPAALYTGVTGRSGVCVCKGDASINSAGDVDIDGVGGSIVTRGPGGVGIEEAVEIGVRWWYWYRGKDACVICIGGRAGRWDCCTGGCITTVSSESVF